MASYIDKAPPVTTGDADKDLKALAEYCWYLYEQINFIVSQINKTGGE
jgi:hypothetical protein